MPVATFEHQPDNPIVLFPGQVLDVQMFGDPESGFDPNTAVKHFKYKMHATQQADEALYSFKVSFFNDAMNEEGSPWENSTIVIQEGWIGDPGDAWGISGLPADQSVFVSDHGYYGTEEAPLTGPAYLGPYEAQDGGSSWQTNVIDTAKTNNRLPGGGYWFIRFELDEGAPGTVTVEEFSFEFTYQEWQARAIFPVPLTEGWVCANSFPSPQELYVLVHKGFAYLYGEILDWYNYNEEEDEDWFTEPYEDATTKLVESGGLPEIARPDGRIEVPIRFYDFDRPGVGLGITWWLSIRPDGSIHFLPREGKPDKLRLGGGSYGFAPMQVRWPIGDTSDTDGILEDSTWETHNSLVNNGEVSGQVWEVDSDIRLLAHGGVTHMRGAVHHDEDTFVDVPLWHAGGVLDDEGTHSFDGVKVLDESGGVGQDFGFIQQLTWELVGIPGGTSIQFDASASTGQQPLQYAWDFGDGTTGSGVTPVHTYDDPGTYWVKLTVTDPRDRTDSVKKRPESPGPPDGYPGESNDWAAYVNDNGAVINGGGQHTLFRSIDPLTQVFKGEMESGSIPNAPGTHLIGSDATDDYFTANKEFIEGGIRLATIDQLSPEMPWETASVVGRKYGTVVCLQGDGDHYRHEVECITAGPSRTNVYRHKLFKCVGGVDTQLGSTVNNQYPYCSISGVIAYDDVEQVQWTPALSPITINDSDVPKSGGWGIFFTGDVTQSLVTAEGNVFPSCPAPGELVAFDVWWPSAYEFEPEVEEP